MSHLRREVLKCFKNLHVTRKKTFAGDEVALTAARHKINEEFKKNKNLEDVRRIEERLYFGNDVIKELRNTVIQAEEVKPGVYRAKITEDTPKLDNVMFDENAKIPPPRSRKCK